MATPRETKVVPSIYRTPYGWRVYVRRPDPLTGRSAKRAFRFPPETTIEDLEYFRDRYKLESRKLRRKAAEEAQAEKEELAGTLREAAAEYLELATVKAMPSYKDRVRDVNLWVAALGDRQVDALTTRDVDEQLQEWIDEEFAASTVNHRRTALMHLFTALRGRAAANPVRAARVFDEPELEPRGLPYDLVVRILDAVPSAWVHSAKPTAKVLVVKTRIRLEVMAWTGMRPAQLMRLERHHVNFKEHWYLTPRSKKGARFRTPRHPRPIVRKPMSADAEAALTRFFEHKCEGKFSTSSARRLFARAVRHVEQELQKGDPTFRMPRGIKPYDLRHSFGTEMLRRTKSLETVAELLDHSGTRMTRRYALGAIPDVLKDAVQQFEQATTAGARQVDEQPVRAKAPAPRKKRDDAPAGTAPAGTTSPVTD